MSDHVTIVGQAGFENIVGSDANEWIIGDHSDVLALGQGSLTAAADGAFHLSLDQGAFAQNHSVFAIVLDGQTQSVQSTQLVWAQTHVDVQDFVLDVTEGDVVVFGILKDGGDLNDFSTYQNGTFSVVSLDDGTLGLSWADETDETILDGVLSLSTTPGVAAGAIEQGQQTVYVGVEDGYGGDDGDFDDLMFSVEVDQTTAQTLWTASQNTTSDNLEGAGGADTIVGDDDADLIAGGGSAGEWSLVDGKWVYDPSAIPDDPDPNLIMDTSNDVLVGGEGNDVLLGNLGDDDLRGGLGDDLLNGGAGLDQLKGGAGADILNLEDGNDFGVGGDGADTMNAGAGDDIMFGDLEGTDLLVSDETDAAVPLGSWSSSQHAAQGLDILSQTVSTTPGQTYDLALDLSSNFVGWTASSTVELYWDGALIGEVTLDGADSTALTASFMAEHESGVLEIRSNASLSNGLSNPDAVLTQQTTLTTAQGDQTVTGFAADQGHLYQVLDGQLTRLDASTGTYMPIGDDPGVRTNAIGYNAENNLIYGVSNQDGTDSSGAQITSGDVVAYDALGQVHLVGSGQYADVAGDFDNAGNLWIFDISLNRITRIDVDNIGDDGSVLSTDFIIDPDAYPFNIYDLTYHAQTNSFIGVKGAAEHGEEGLIVRIDLNDVENGGTPTISTLPIESTLVNGAMLTGISKGAFGAAFSDADGNVYVSLNTGDHDLDASTADQGAVYQVITNEDGTAAYLDYIADTHVTTTNDGAMDARAVKPFGGVDLSANVVMENISLVENTGEGDVMRGAEGADSIFGGGGGDLIHGGDQDDMIQGDQGADLLFGGAGADILYGGEADDYLEGDEGNDFISGGNGADFLKGEEGADTLDSGYGDDTVYAGSENDVVTLGQGRDRGFGGDGDDTVFGGRGDDHLEGGDGNDHISGGDDDDILFGGIGDDAVTAGNGDDRAYGGYGDDTLSGNAGDDNLIGNAGDDAVSGGDGDDVINGSAGSDTLSGDAQNDMIFGGIDADNLQGGAGDDQLIGGAGADTLEGGTGNDHLWGGNFMSDNAADIFIYIQGGGQDMVHDFETNHDRIDLSAFGLTFEDLQSRFNDLGWATEINFTGLEGAGDMDRMILRSVPMDQLHEDNFIL
ncbi:MAG: calcium-binding protein [Planktomarina sp.]